jgi:hypothetical protein
MALGTLRLVVVQLRELVIGDYLQLANLAGLPRLNKQGTYTTARALLSGAGRRRARVAKLVLKAANVILGSLIRHPGVEPIKEFKESLEASLDLGEIAANRSTLTTPLHGGYCSSTVGSCIGVSPAKCRLDRLVAGSSGGGLQVGQRVREGIPDMLTPWFPVPTHSSNVAPELGQSVLTVDERRELGCDGLLEQPCPQFAVAVILHGRGAALAPRDK